MYAPTSTSITHACVHASLGGECCVEVSILVVKVAQHMFVDFDLALNVERVNEGKQVIRGVGLCVRE